MYGMNMLMNEYHLDLLLVLFFAKWKKKHNSDTHYTANVYRNIKSAHQKLHSPFSRKVSNGSKNTIRLTARLVASRSTRFTREQCPFIS